MLQQSIDNPIVFKDDPHLKNEILICLVGQYLQQAATNSVSSQPILRFGTLDPNSSRISLLSKQLSRNKVWTQTIENKNVVLIPLIQENTQILEPRIDSNCQCNTKTGRLYVNDLKLFNAWSEQLAHQILKDNIFDLPDGQLYKTVYSPQRSQGKYDMILQNQTTSINIDQNLPKTVEPELQNDEVPDLNNTSLELPSTIETNNLLNTEVNERPQSFGPSQESHTDPIQFERFKLVLMELSDSIEAGKIQKADKAEEAPLVPSQEDSDSAEDPTSVKFIISHVKPDEVMVILKSDSTNTIKSSESTTISRPQYLIIPTYSDKNCQENIIRVNVEIEMDEQAQTRLSSIVEVDVPQAGYLPFSFVSIPKQDKIYLFITVQDEKTGIDVKIKEEQKSCLILLPPIKQTKTSKGKFSKESLESIADVINSADLRPKRRSGRVRSSVSTNISSVNNLSGEESEDDFNLKLPKRDQECQTDVNIRDEGSQISPERKDEGIQTESIVIETPCAPDKPKEVTLEEFESKGYKPLLYTPKGLTNIGNTCYMNSNLQCLLSTRKLYSFFTSLFADKSEISKLQNKKLSLAFLALINQTKNPSSVGGQILGRIKQSVSDLNEDFSDYGQKDALELFSTFLEGLNDELNRVNQRPPYKQLKTEPRENIQEMSEEWFSYMRSSKNSIITDTFTGQLFNRAVCRACKKEKFSFQDYQSLSLSFQGCNVTEKGVHLEKMLEKFLQGEISNDYWCSHCDGETTCLTRTIIWRLPPVLVIHLKRFDSQRGRYCKVDTPVTFQTESFDMSKFVQESKDISVKDAEYCLFATVNHNGSLNGGHYTATCLDLKEKVMYQCSDNSISKTKRWEPVCKTEQSPLMLFYIKKCFAMEDC